MGAISESGARGQSSVGKRAYAELVGATERCRHIRQLNVVSSFHNHFGRFQYVRYLILISLIIPFSSQNVSNQLRQQSSCCGCVIDVN